MKIWPGYDARSPTLSSRQALYGTCLGADFERWRYCYVDPGAPIFSGDLVRMWLNHDDGTTAAIIKFLEYCRGDARWYGRCNDGVFQIGVWVRPHRIEKVVALEAGTRLNREVDNVAGENARALFERESQFARDEWARDGYPIGVPFPGLPSIVSEVHFVTRD